MPGDAPVAVKLEPDAVKHEQDAPATKTDAAYIAELEAKLAERESYIAYCDEHGVSHTHCLAEHERCNKKIAELEQSLADQTRVVDTLCTQLRAAHFATMRLQGGQARLRELSETSSRDIKIEPGTEYQLPVREPSEEGEVADGPAPSSSAHPIRRKKGKRKWDSYRPGDVDMYRPTGQMAYASHPFGSAVDDQTPPRAAVDRTHETGRNTASDGLQHANEEEMPAPKRVRVPLDESCTVDIPHLMEANDLRTAQSEQSQQNPEQAVVGQCLADHVALLALAESTAAPHTHAPAGAGPSPTESDNVDITATAMLVDPRDSTLRIGKRHHPPPRAPGPKAARRRVGPPPRSPPRYQ
ncbi:hypothetical protein B0A48_15450 [Cryoendolithus antarcticus]|uniref:Uncharacterized protein n=1 Tax=Cryoendolithus antarcticus TaxID=1507870 RepID=A0A1V8SIT5_9PEZI|nr:hypothetical protein B0A48_15450 [Cryoendolithus antarcticus]